MALVAYEVAIDLVRDLRPLVEQIRKHDNTLAKQLVDAMNSTVQNLSEGAVHRGGNKRAKFDIAFGEANEVKGSLDLALAWGYIPDDARAAAAHAKLPGCSRCAGDSHGESRHHAPRTHDRRTQPFGLIWRARAIV